MKIVKQSHKILFPATEEEWRNECRLIEEAGRTAYKSEDHMTLDSYEKFIKMIIGRGHEAVIEFGSMTVRLVTDRGITHEIVRHRLCSFVQESTRYCNYSQDKFGNELTFIQPGGDLPSGGVWEESCRNAEEFYLHLLKTNNWTPQMARSVLPNCVKTEIVVKANFREWRHIFRLRAISKAAHPDMRRLMIPLYEQCRKECPLVFEMGDVE